jgi:hypothetical protein
VTTSLTSRNNLYDGVHYALRKINTIAVGFDYDDLHAASAPLARWYSTDYADLAALRAGTGQELHGISAAPLLAAPASGDFMPLGASPLVDHGVLLPGINDGYADAAPDIGAVERVDLIFADGYD